MHLVNCCDDEKKRLEDSKNTNDTAKSSFPQLFLFINFTLKISVKRINIITVSLK